ncbi:MAG: MBL fold metallo-hydrolase [Rickettsiales bacterium]|nr:MBL fold metallo-hydrolase [Rickettsiales bacterium]
MSDLHVTVLGCGASAGVPMIGCDCAVCSSADPRNRRSRVSLLIEQYGKRLLIDVSPDFRQQCLNHHVSRLDAILFTHAHADHCHGIDDLRPINHHMGMAIPAYGDPAAMDEILQRFGYAFKEPIAEYGWFRPALIPHILDVDNLKPFQVGDMQVQYFPQVHGKTMTLGVRVGNVAYSTDVNHFPEAAFEYLHNLDLWIVDCLRYSPSPTHAHLEMTLQWIAQFKPKRAILTHMSHDFDYESFARDLPEGVEPAYDGLSLTIKTS